MRISSLAFAIVILALQGCLCKPSPSPSPPSPSPPLPARPSLSGIPPVHWGNITDGIQVPSCNWQPILGTCGPSHSFLLAFMHNFSQVPYGGRAAAFLVAGNAYCSQFKRTDSNCSYPCANNGEACTLSGAVTYGLYTCPDTQAEQDVYCMLAPYSSKSLCNATQECHENPGQGTKPGSCVADFKAQFSQAEYRQYLGDWGTIRRNVWGCCKGSNAKWMNDLHCSRFSSYRSECLSNSDCIFSNKTGDCTWEPNAWIDYNFGPNALLTSTLKIFAKTCTSFTTQKSCEGFRSISAFPSAVKSILNFKFDSINDSVPDSECVVWDQDS